MRDALKAFGAARDDAFAKLCFQKWFKVERTEGTTKIYAPCSKEDKGAQEFNFLNLLAKTGPNLKIVMFKPGPDHIQRAIQQTKSGTHPLRLAAYKMYHENGYLEESQAILFRQ